MKNINTSILRYTITGITLGLLIVSIAMLVNYNNGFNGYYHQLFQYSHDFIIITSMPILLGVLFCYLGSKRDKDISINYKITHDLIREKNLHNTARSKLERALQVARVGSWEIDYVNDRKYISSELRRIYDLPAEGTISYEELYKNVLEEDLPILRRMTDEAASNLKQVDFEYRYIIRGEMNYMISSISPHVNEKGQLINLFGTVQNISHIKRTELSLKKSEEEKAIVLNNTQALIFVHDQNGIILNVNQAGQKASGYEAGELVGQNINCLISKSYENKVNDYLEEIGSNKNTQGTLHVITRSGEKKVWLYQNTFYDNNGHDPYIIASAIDITESVLARFEIEKQQQFTRKIIDSSPNVVFVVNDKHQIIMANKAFGNFYDYNEKEMPQVASLYKGKEDIILDIPDINNMEEDEMIKTSGKVQTKNEGPQYWFTIIKKCFKKSDGKKYIVCFGMDITDRYQIECDLKEANETAERSSNVKKQFLANMSHEIRTPLNAVIGFTDLLADTSLNEEQNEYVDIVKTASQNLLALINDILDMSKIESGNMELEHLPVDIRKIIKDVKSILEPKAKSKSLDIFCNFSNDLPPEVLGDQLRLSQIMFNLIGNAVKFTDHGNITIHCEELKTADSYRHYIAFSVKDTGIGIPLDKHKDIFERFTQANLNTQRLYGGTGLGLSIVKSIVDLQGGKISVESNPGEGTTFHFILPFKKYDVSQESNDITHHYGIDLQAANQVAPIKVLLAEDHKVNAKLAVKVLNKQGFEVTYVENGALAVEAVEQQQFDVVLMDIQMPEMDGIEATRRIRMLEGEASQIPIVAMTAHSFNGEMENCYRAGMNGYVSKPFKAQDLFSAIFKAINYDNKNEALPAL